MYGKGYHFFFDYKDMGYHLIVGNDEVNLPKEFKDELCELCSMRDSLQRAISLVDKHDTKLMKSMGVCDVCSHCKMSKRLRNPSGYCDHLYFPENCEICASNQKGE